MRIAKPLAGILVSVFVLTVAPAAQANPITFSYFGTVTSLSDPNNTLGGSAGVGSTFTISFTFDPLVPDFSPDPVSGLYQWTDPALTMRITIGSAFFEYQMADIRTQNDLETSSGVFADSYFPRAFEPGTAGPGLDPMLAEFQLTQIGPAASLLTSDALPLTPPDPTLANALNRFQFSNTNELSFEGTLAPGPAASTTIPAPGYQPSGLAFDGTYLFVSEASGFRTIFKLDPATGTILGSFVVGGSPSDIVSDGASRLFVSDIGNFGAGIVNEIDSAGTITFNSFLLPFRGGAIAFDGTNLFIGNFDGSEILVTDRSGTPIRTFVTGLRPAGMIFDPTTGHLWVISQFDRTISEITTQGDLIRECDGPRDPGIQGHGAVTLVGSRLYIAEVSDPDPFTPPDIPGTIFIVDPKTLSCDPPLVLTVTTDIKPGSDPNAINPVNRGLIPVAILTTEDFDAAIVSPSTVQFGPGGGSIAHRSGHLEDADGDGDLDLVLHFRTQETGIQCEDTEASLTGETFDGQPIQSSDSIVTVGCL